MAYVPVLLSGKMTLGTLADPDLNWTGLHTTNVTLEKQVRRTQIQPHGNAYPQSDPAGIQYRITERHAIDSADTTGTMGLATELYCAVASEEGDALFAGEVGLVSARRIRGERGTYEMEESVWESVGDPDTG